MKKTNQIIILAIIITLVVIVVFAAGFEYCEKKQPQPVKAKIIVGKACVETDMSIEEWYFQQKLWTRINMPEQRTQICN